MTLTSEFIFKDDRPFISCHASTILRTTDELLLCAWFGGSYEQHEDVAIWLSSKNNTSDWSYPEKIADEEGLSHFNPVLAQSPSGSINLFYKVGPNARDWRTRVKRKTATSGNWTKAEELLELDGFTVGPVKDKPIILDNGSWLAPTSKETTTRWDAAVTISHDDGKNWQLGGPVPINHSEFIGLGIIQPTLWESGPGCVHMLLRSTANKIYRSDSSDYGLTWSEAYAIDLPNNNSGIDLAKLSDGRILLVYNPVSTSWGKRTPLVVSISSDNGYSWSEIAILENEDPPFDEEKIKLDRSHRPNEFSYPAIVTYDNEAFITYTWKRERIRYHHLTF